MMKAFDSRLARYLLLAGLFALGCGGEEEPVRGGQGGELGRGGEASGAGGLEGDGGSGPDGAAGGAGGEGDGGGSEEPSKRRCDPGERRSCYTGPEGTEGIGQCRAGEQVCREDGSGFGPCSGQQLPTASSCGPHGCNEACLPFCGNGIVEPGEACDEGALNGRTGIACSTSCESRRPIAIQAGGHRTCAILGDGTVKCWGMMGLAGSGCYGDEPAEVGHNLLTIDLGTGREATALSMGERFSCAILDDRSLKCWGMNAGGQLGIGSTSNRGDPDMRGHDPYDMGDLLPAVDLGKGATPRSLASGAHHSCAILELGNMKCWGDNFDGQLGNGGDESYGHTPESMGRDLPFANLGTGPSGHTTIEAIALGQLHSCAILSGGGVKCWGSNLVNQLGHALAEKVGSSERELGESLPFVDLGKGRLAKEIFAGWGHNCAILKDDSLKCWGWNGSGQLGVGDSRNRGAERGDMGDALPEVDLGRGRKAISLALGMSHSCAILDDGTVKCWGLGAYGQLGYGAPRTRGTNRSHMGDALPRVDLGVGRIAKAITAGSHHTCVLLDDDTVKCWGYNSCGQLGIGDNHNRGDDPDETGDRLPEVKLY